MIAPVLEVVRRRTDAGDALGRSVERTVVTIEAGRLKAAGVTEQSGINLRVQRGGRIGVAGGTGAVDPARLVERALASAELGESVALAWPVRSTPPQVAVYFDRAAQAPLDALVQLGRGLAERLARDGCQVNVSVEREVSETTLGSTTGASGAYRATEVGVSADLTRIAGDDVLMVYDQYVACDLPSDADVDALARSIATRLELALNVVAPPEGPLPVVFTPAGLRAVLLPLEQALSGKAVLQGVSPLAGRLSEAVFDPALTLVDDPLQPGRPSSRPIDDEAVPSRVVPLVERGAVRHFIYDLETAARAGTASTGHGHRGIFGKPQPAYTNLVLGVGDSGRGAGAEDLGGGLLDGIADGLVVDDLIGVGQGNVIGGAFSHPVALAYRVERGEITGRVKDAAVAGDAYTLLRRVGGVGADARWVGATLAPSVLLEGVSVSRR